MICAICRFPITINNDPTPDNIHADPVIGAVHRSCMPEPPTLEIEATDLANRMRHVAKRLRDERGKMFAASVLEDAVAPLLSAVGGV